MSVAKEDFSSKNYYSRSLRKSQKVSKVYRVGQGIREWTE